MEATASTSHASRTSVRYFRPMEVRVLGPLEVWVDGPSVAVGGPKQRALLGLLTAVAPRSVAVDTLIEELWGEESTAGARSTLQPHISNLRHVLDGRVIHERGGYRLDIDTAAIDAVRFGATLEKARVEIATDAAGAAAALKGALVSACPRRVRSGVGHCHP